MFKKRKKSYAPQKPILRETDMRISPQAVQFVVEECESRGQNPATILGQILLSEFQKSVPETHLDRAVGFIQAAQSTLKMTAEKGDGA